VKSLLKSRILLYALPILALLVLVGVVGVAFLIGRRVGSSVPSSPTPKPTLPFPSLTTATPTLRPTKTGTPQPSPTPSVTPIPTSTFTPTPTPTPTPRVIISEIKSLGRLETTRYLMETVIDLAREPENIWQQVMGTDKLLLVAAGEVVAGFDLTRVSASDITVQGDNVLIVLPPPQILYSKVDNKRTYVYERATGLFQPPDPQLEGDARQLAEQAMVNRALEGEILQVAEENGRLQLEAFLRTLGFTEIVILVQGE